MQRLRREHLVLTGLCAAVLALFVLLWLVPSIQEHHRLFRAIPPARQQLKDLKQAVPLLATLRASHNNLPEERHATSKAVPVEETSALLSRIRRIAKQSGVDLHDTEMTVLPPTEKENERLGIGLRLAGPAPASRDFLQRLHALPEVADMDHVLIEAATPEAVRMTIHLLIDLAP